MSCLKVFYKTSFLKQYNKGGRVLRTELCVNDPRHLGIGCSLVNLDYLGTVAYDAVGRFLKPHAVTVATTSDRANFEPLISPSQDGDRRVAGLRFGTPPVMRLLAALGGCAALTVKAFSHRELRALLVDGLGAEPSEVTAARLSYRLAKLRGKGVLHTVVGQSLHSDRSRYRAALYLTTLYQRLHPPTLDSVTRRILSRTELVQYSWTMALVTLSCEVTRTGG